MKIYITTDDERAVYISRLGDDDQVYMLVESGNTFKSNWVADDIEKDVNRATPSFREISLTGKQLYNAIVETYKEE